MADTGIFGLSEEEIRRMLAQFGASPEDKSAANSERWITAGLSMLANPHRGQELQAIGQGGLAGQAAYRDTLNQRVKDRGAAITQGVGIQKMMKDSALTDYQLQLLNEGRAPGAGGPSAAAPGGFRPGGTVADAFSAPSAGATQAAPQQANVTVLTFMQKARNLGVEEPVRLALASGGPEGFRKAAEIISEHSKPHFGQGVNPIVRDPNSGNFIVKPPQGMSDVLAANAGAVEGAKAGFDFVQVPDGRGGTTMMSRADAAKTLGGTQQRPPPIVNEDKNVPFTDAERAAMERDQARPAGYSQGPVQQHAATAAIDTTEQGKRTAQTTRAANSERMYDAVRQQYMAARDMAPHLANMEKLDAEGVFSGPAGALGEKAASWINSAFPDANVSAQKLGNSESYRSEISRLQQAIAKSFPGSQSDKELSALLSSLPDLMLNPQGRAQVREVLSRKAADAERVYDSASEHFNKNDTLVGWKPPGFTPPSQSFGAAPPAQAPKPAAAMGPNVVGNHVFPSPAAAQAFRVDMERRKRAGTP